MVAVISLSNLNKRAFLARTSAVELRSPELSAMEWETFSSREGLPSTVILLCDSDGCSSLKIMALS